MGGWSKSDLDTMVSTLVSYILQETPTTHIGYYDNLGAQKTSEKREGLLAQARESTVLGLEREINMHLGREESDTLTAKHYLTHPRSMGWDEGTVTSWGETGCRFNAYAAEHKKKADKLKRLVKRIGAADFPSEVVELAKIKMGGR